MRQNSRKVKIERGDAIRAVRERNRCLDAVSDVLNGATLDNVVGVCLGIALDAAHQAGYSREEFMAAVKRTARRVWATDNR
jgi:hypothetical protein